MRLDPRWKSSVCILIPFSILVTSVLAGCGSSASSAPTPTPGVRDIPDNARYLTFPGQGYSLKYVEGWQQQLGPGVGVTIADKDSAEVVAIVPGKQPNGAFAASDLSTLRRTLPQFHLNFLHAIQLPAGPSVRVQYKTLSARDQVTGRRVPVVVDRYYISGPSKHAIITLSTPEGVDNVDAFRLIAHSFRWH